MDCSNIPRVSLTAPPQSLSARRHARQAAAAFLASSDECSQPRFAAAPLTALQSTQWDHSATAGANWIGARRSLHHGRSSFLGWPSPRHDDQLPPYMQGLLPKGFNLRLAGHDSGHGHTHGHDSGHGQVAEVHDAHQVQINPLAVGVASMIGGTLLGAGIVAVVFGQRQGEQDAEADDMPLGEPRGSQTFVAFQGTGNRMDEEVTTASDAGLAVATERPAPAVSAEAEQREARLKAEQESRSKAKAKQKAEEETRVKAEEEARSKSAASEEATASSASAGPAAAAASDDYALGGNLQLGSNPKSRREEKKEKKEKKHKKKREPDALAGFTNWAAAAAADAADVAAAAAAAVDGATDQMVGLLDAAEEGFQSADSGEGEEEEEGEPDQPEEAEEAGEADGEATGEAAQSKDAPAAVADDETY